MSSKDEYSPCICLNQTAIIDFASWSQLKAMMFSEHGRHQHQVRSWKTFSSSWTDENSILSIEESSVMPKKPKAKTKEAVTCLHYFNLAFFITSLQKKRADWTLHLRGKNSLQNGFQMIQDQEFSSASKIVLNGHTELPDIITPTQWGICLFLRPSTNQKCILV